LRPRIAVTLAIVPVASWGTVRRMRRDIVDSALDETDEAFVERMWTEVWDAEPDPSGEPPDLSETEQFRGMEPWLRLLPADARLLDAGCGLGGWTRFLSARGLRTVGLDLSRRTIERLQQMHPDEQFVTGDLRATDFDDASFDAEFSWGAFEHFEEGIGRCVAEAYRLLKPGGLLFITVPLENHRVRFLSRERRSGRFYQWRFRPNDLRRELEEGGFEVVKIHPVGKWEGTRRSLHELLRLDPDWPWTMRVTTLAARLLPSSAVGHMQFAAARKPTRQG
jgi:SAM-dependent methyltransferase